MRGSLVLEGWGRVGSQVDASWCNGSSQLINVVQGNANIQECSDTTGLPKLGVIAAVQLDGSVSFYSVPRPEAVRKTLSQTETNSPLYRELLHST